VDPVAMDESCGGYPRGVVVVKLSDSRRVGVPSSKGNVEPPGVELGAVALLARGLQSGDGSGTDTSCRWYGLSAVGVVDAGPSDSCQRFCERRSPETCLSSSGGTERYTFDVEATGELAKTSSGGGKLGRTRAERRSGWGGVDTKGRDALAGELRRCGRGGRASPDAEEVDDDEE
jgi:hypothetical protein